MVLRAFDCQHPGCRNRTTHPTGKCDKHRNNDVGGMATASRAGVPSVVPALTPSARLQKRGKAQTELVGDVFGQEAVEYGLQYSEDVLIATQEGDVHGCKDLWDQGYRPVIAQDVKAPCAVKGTQELLGARTEIYTMYVGGVRTGDFGQPEFFVDGEWVEADEGSEMWVDESGVPEGYSLGDAKAQIDAGLDWELAKRFRDAGVEPLTESRARQMSRAVKADDSAKNQLLDAVYLDIDLRTKEHVLRRPNTEPDEFLAPPWVRKSAKTAGMDAGSMLREAYRRNR